MPDASELAFLIDVDNTLLDNDRVTADLRRHLTREIGLKAAERYFEIFEARREELGYADYLGALQRYREENPCDPHVLYLSHYLVDYPFANRLYPESLDVLDDNASDCRLGIPPRQPGLFTVHPSLFEPSLCPSGMEACFCEQIAPYELREGGAAWCSRR